MVENVRFTEPGKPTESQGEVRGVLMHRSEQCADEVEIAA